MAAEDNERNEEKDGEEGNANNKKRWILFALLVLLIIGVSVGGTLVGVKMLNPEPEQDAPIAESDTAAPPKPVIYYPLKPAIVVNFSVRGRQRTLQAELTLMTREDDVISAVALHQPMIRNALILLIGGQTYAEIQTAEGKELLRQQCLQTIQRLLEKEIGKPGIEQVLFTSFVMQ